MEHIAAFLLIIGCSDDLSRCSELPAPQPVFETVEDCDAELSGSFGRFASGYPQLFAKCFEVDPELAESDSELVWSISPEGDLLATVEPIAPDEVLVASVSERGR